METGSNHFRDRFSNRRGWSHHGRQLYSPRDHGREPSYLERERAYNGEERDWSFRRSPSHDRQRTMSHDSDRMVNRRRRSVSPSSDRDRIVHLKSNCSHEKERFGRGYRTSRNRRYESEEEDRYADSTQNDNFTQNHSSYRSYRDGSSRHERCDKRYTHVRSSGRNNDDIRYERDEDEKQQLAHIDYRQRNRDTLWNGHVDKYQSHGRRRRDNYYDDSDNFDDVNSREGPMYIDRRDRPLDKTLYGGQTTENGEDSSNHRNARGRQADSESAASDWSTDETRQLEDGEIRSPSRDIIGNASLKHERFDLLPVSNKSNNSAFDQYYDSDTNRSYTSTYQESNIEDENEYLVEQQFDAFTRKYTLTLDTMELLKTLTDELEQEIAADIMSILLSAGIALPIEILRDKLKEKNKFFELITLEKFLEGKFRVEETKLTTYINVPAGTMVVSPFPNTHVKLCAKHSNFETKGKCNCTDLHICKFFLLSTCPTGSNCRFGHNLRSDHNIRVLKTHFLHRLTLSQIKNFIRRKENRNRTTTPEICKFYNTERGCKHETDFDSWSMCQYLNICRFYISSSCKFGTRCKRSHDLFSRQPRKVLSLYGLKPEFGSQNDIVAMLNRVTNSSDEVTATRPKDLQMQTDLLVNDTKKIDGKLALRLLNEANFIPLIAPDQDRYFSHHSSDSTSNSNGRDLSPDVSGNSSTVSSEEEADSETEADVYKKHSSPELAKTNNLKSRKRNLTTDILESADRAKMPKISAVGENSDALDTTMTLLPLQTNEFPTGLECIGLDNIRKEATSEPMANIDVDTIKIETSVQKKELQEVGTIEKANVDTVNTEITSQKYEFPDNIENVDIGTSKTETSSPTNDMGTSKTETSSELHYQRSLSSPSRIKSKETAGIKEGTDTEIVGQVQNLGEGDVNRKGVADSFGWRLTEECEIFGLMQEFPFRTLEDKYKQFINGACCEIKFQDKRLIFNFKTMDGKLLTEENEEIEIQLEREPNC